MLHFYSFGNPSIHTVPFFTCLGFGQNFRKKKKKKRFHVLFPAVPLRLLAFLSVTGNSTVHNTMVQTKSVKLEPYAAKHSPWLDHLKHFWTILWRKRLTHQSLVKCPNASFASFFFYINVNHQRKPSRANLQKLNPQQWQRQCVFVCHPHSLPTAWGQDDKRQAGMGLWALDCRNPAHFHVVNIQPEAGHCYRFNNRNDYETQTACIHVPGLMGRPFPNGLIHLHVKCEDRIVTIICRASCSLSNGAVPPWPQVHLLGMFTEEMKKRSYD